MLAVSLASCCHNQGTDLLLDLAVLRHHPVGRGPPGVHDQDTQQDEELPLDPGSAAGARTAGHRPGTGPPELRHLSALRPEAAGPNSGRQGRCGKGGL